MHLSSHAGSHEQDEVPRPLVLIVEHEGVLADTLREALEDQEFMTVVAHSAEEAWEVLWNTAPDVMLLDLTLPEGEDVGFDFARELREADYRLPILFLTAPTSLPKRIYERRLGTDYLAKPFGMAELVARLRALYSRVEPEPHAVRWKGFELLTEARQLLHEGVPVRLTAKEYEVLKLFMLNPGRIFSREEVIEQAWGDRYETPPNLVDVYVKNLRGKLMDKVIETVNGLGYRFSG